MSKTAGYLQYRFGTAKNIELSFPSALSGSSQKFFFTHYFRSQTDYSNLNFSNGGSSYTVFKTYDGESKPAIDEAGVSIGLSKGKEVRVLCSKNIVNNLADLSGIANCDKDDALNLGQCP